MADIEIRVACGMLPSLNFDKKLVDTTCFVVRVFGKR
jgi:hypothetical protein